MTSEDTSAVGDERCDAPSSVVLEKQHAPATPQSISGWDKFDMLTRHPLSITLITIALGSVIIPMVTTWQGQMRLLNEAKLAKATNIIGNNSEVNKQINALNTMLEVFHKNNASGAIRKADLVAEQTELRRRFDAAYLDFDRNAWWWFQDVVLDASLLGLSDANNRRVLQNAIRAYKSNLTESAGALYKFAYVCLRADYQVNSASNAVMAQTRQRLSDLRVARERLILRTTNVFVPQ